LTMTHILQIILFGALTILLALKIDMSRVSRAERLARDKFVRLVRAVDSVVAGEQSPETAGLLYKSRIMLENAHIFPEKIAAARFFLGAVETFDIPPEQVENLKRLAFSAIGTFHRAHTAKMMFRKRWHLPGAQCVRISEEQVVAARKRLLTNFYRDYVKFNPE